MPRTAQSIIARAIQISKTGNISTTGIASGYTRQALDELNSVLDHIANTVDFQTAMGTWNFTMNTALASSGAGNIIQASPNPLPLDYLRVQTSGGSSGAQRSSTWYLQGVPYPMIEIDLTEWDQQVQQAGIQSYPYFWAKDLSSRAILFNVTGDLSSASTSVTNLSSTAGMVAGMSIAGGIGPLSAIVPGTTIVSVNSTTTLTLSAAPTLTLAGASLMVGYPGSGLPYPPPSGAYNARVRYQRVMPPLTQAQVDAGVYPWFDDDMVLTNLLAARLMGYADDTRVAQYEALGNEAMKKYLPLADDRSNRANVVELDRRRFGGAFSGLPNTKLVGWLVLLCVGLGGIVGTPPC